MRARAFGMPVVVWSRRFAADPDERARVSAALALTVVDQPVEVVKAADVLSIHLALAKDTRGFVNADLLSHLKPGAFVVNTARAEVVDQPALAAAIRDRGLRAALDVFAAEPAAATGPFADDIVQLPGRLWHPSHRRLDRPGSGSDRRRDRAHRPHLQGHRAGTQRGEPGPDDAGDAHAGGAAPRSPGVLAHVFGEIRAAGLNVQETENVIFDGAEAAVARINLDGAPSRATVDAVRATRRGARRPARVPAYRRSLIPGPATCLSTRFSISPPAPPFFPNPCCSKRSAISSPCPASACRCSRSAIARRLSKRFSPRPRPTCGPSAACRRTTRCCSCRAARRCSSRWCR